MTTKVYTYESSKGTDDTVTVMKWLRSQGERDLDFRIHQLNYRLVRVEFLNERMELAYTLKYAWSSE